MRAAEMNFSVKAALPKNQINHNIGYFDLRMKPEQIQTIQVILENSTNEEVVVEVYPNVATTSSIGNVDYSEANSEYDDSLAYPFSELVTTENEVNIQPHSSYTLDVTIQMPEESFDGMILGGLYFIEKDTDAENSEESVKATQVENRFSYTIGVKLTETDVQVTPELLLNKVYPSQVNYRNVVNVHLQNPTATVIENLEIEAAVYSKNGNKLLYQMNKGKITMAPNSNFDYGISLEKQRFKSGVYRLEMTAVSGEQQWEWTELFTIEKEEAEFFNSEAVELEESALKIWLWISVCLVGGIVIIFVITKKKRGDMSS